MFPEPFLIRKAREKAPRFVVSVLLENSDAAFWHHARKFFEEQRGIVDKRNDPAAPRKIVIPSRQIAGHQIQFVNLYVCKRASATGFFHRTHKLTRTLDRDYFTRRLNNFRKIDSCVAGACSDIQYAAAHSDTGFLPAIQDHGTPDPMLQTKSRQLLIVRAENIIAFLIHDLLSVAPSQSEDSRLIRFIPKLTFQPCRANRPSRKKYQQ